MNTTNNQGDRMAPVTEERQEARIENVSVAVTSAEHGAVKAVASARGITKSDVLRRWNMDEVMEQAARIRAALGDDEEGGD